MDGGRHRLTSFFQTFQVGIRLFGRAFPRQTNMPACLTLHWLGKAGQSVIPGLPGESGVLSTPPRITPNTAPANRIATSATHGLLRDRKGKRPNCGLTTVTITGTPRLILLNPRLSHCFNTEDMLPARGITAQAPRKVV